MGFRYLLPIAFLAVSGSPGSPLADQNPSGLIFVSGFDDGRFDGWQLEKGTDHAIRLVESPVRDGRHAVRVELRRDDPLVAGSKRAELKLNSEPSSTTERWYAFSLYLDQGYVRDPAPEIVAQWHATPDRKRGEIWRSPPLALLTQDGNWCVQWLWDRDRVMRKNQFDGQRRASLGPYATGRWTDWVFHVRWAWNGKGLLEVWRDRHKVLSYKGPIGFNDERGVYFKIGLYKWLWATAPGKTTTKKRVIYVDAVRIGNAAAALDDVRP